MHTILQGKSLVKDFLKNWRVKPGGKQILRAKGARRGSGPRCAWNDIRRGLRGFVRTCTGRVGRWDSGRAQPPHGGRHLQRRRQESRTVRSPSKLRVNTASTKAKARKAGQGAACCATTKAKARTRRGGGRWRERREMSGLAAEELFEEEAGEAAGVVAEDAVFLEKIVEDDAEAELLEGWEIDGHRFGALGAVATSHIGRDGFEDGAEMIGKGVAGGFAGLGHQIGDVHAWSFGFGDGAGDFRDQQIRQNAGVERTGTEEDQVGLLDGIDGHRERTHAARGKLEFLDWRAAAGGDAGFAVNGAAVFERGDEMDVRKRRRKNATADGENFAADADGFSEITGNVGQRGEEKIAKIVADETAARVKTILKKAAEEGFILRKSDHAVAYVAGRENAVLAAQAAGASAVIGDGDDGGEIGDGALGAGAFVGAADDEFLETAEERGEAGAAAKSNDAEAAGQSLRFGAAFCHAGVRDG